MSWINRESNNENSGGEKKHPFARWMSWLFLVASLLLLFYAYYRAEVTHQGAGVEKYFKYYLVSLAGVFFWGITLRLRENIRANIVTMAISLVVGLYMIEGGLTFFRPYHSNATATATAAGVEYDQRTKLEVIEDLIAEGIDAVPAARPNNKLILDKRLLPLGGISKKTTVGKNESGRYSIYPSDRYGFNNPDSEWDAKEVKWLLIGDSFTEGSTVQPGEDIAGQLRVITQKSAINLGWSGNGPLTELAALVEYAKAIRSKRVVLWLYYEENDLTRDLTREKAVSLLMKYMENGFSQNLISRQNEIDDMFGEHIEGMKAAYKTQWMRLIEVRRAIDFDNKIAVDVDVDVDDPLFAKILTNAKARVESWRGMLYFIYLPDYSRYNNKAVFSSHDRFMKKSEVLDLVKGLDIPVIDIHKEVFVNHPDSLSLFPLRKRGHYNAKGYAEVAKAIVRGVKNHEQSIK